VPWTPEVNHLAVRTEDHPLEYLTVHGDIPEGEYGAGRMTVWDRGTFEVDKWEDRKVVVVLHGERAEGRYALFHTGGRDGRDWMIHRMDPPADPSRRPPPTDLRPMGLVAGDPPSGDGWAWEARWHGLRVLVTNETGDTGIADATGADVGDRFPELKRIGRAIGSPEVILDGVVVDVGAGAVDGRLRAASSAVRRLAKDRPVQLVLVDLLWWEGHDVLGRPWHERRQLLESLALDGGPWTTPTAHVGGGDDLLAAAAGAGVASLVAKRTASPYCPGEATGDWIEARVG
jgi:bifunctional non-homologous end joining protein LigD